MATTTITESGDYGFTAGAADSYIIKDGVTGVNITDNNADQAVQDNTTSNDLFVVENLTNTTVVINDYATVSGVDKNTNDDLLYIKNAGDGVKVAYFNIYTKAEAVNHQGGVDVAFVSTSANATGSVTAKNHLTINASGNYDKGAGYIDNVLAGEQKVNFNYNNLISKVRTLISKANTALGTSYTSSDDLKGTAYEAEMMALYNGTDENKSYPTYTIGDLSVNSTTGPLLTWLYPVDELEFTQVAGTNEVCITHGNVTQRLSYEEATFSYYAIDQDTYEYKKIDDTMIASATKRAVYELAEGAEPATIAGANYGGVWFRGITSQDNITYRRDYNNLIMTTNDNRQVTVTDFFAETNKVVASFRNDGSAAGGVLNDNANVEMFVNLSQFNGTYQATEYREVFEGSGVVSGLNALSDKVKLTYDNVQLSRTFDGDNNGALTLTDGTNTITVNDYFGKSYVARLIYDSSDPVGAGKSILSKPLDVTLADTKNEYTTHEKFQETIHGKGIIAADSIGVAGTNKDRIVTVGDATFTRENNGDLHVKYGESDDITVTDFDFGGATKNINVNGNLTSTESTEIAVTLTDGHAYTTTVYAESISGTGSVTGLGANDKLVTSGETVKYMRENDGGLIVWSGNGELQTDKITVTDFIFDGEHDITVNNGTTENMILNVDLDGTVTYAATSYAEIFSGVGSVTGFVNSKDGVVPKGSPVLIRENNSTDLSVDGITIKNFDFSTSNPFRIFDGNTSTQSTDYPIYVTLRDVGGEPTEYQSTGYKEYIDGKGIVNLSGDHPFDLSQDAVYVDGWSDIHYTRENNWDLHFVQGDDTDITVKGFNFAGGTDFRVTNGTITELTTNMTIDVTLTGIIGDDYHSASGYAERIKTKASTAIQFAENSDKDTLVFDTTADNITYRRNGNNLYVINKAGEDEIYTIIKGYYTLTDMSVAGQFAGVKVDTTSADTTLGNLSVTEIENVSNITGTDKGENIYLEKLTEGVIPQNASGDFPNYDEETGKYTSNVLGNREVKIDAYAAGMGGDDVIYGTEGNDWINGGDGNDLIVGGASGKDMLAGGDGQNEIYAGTFVDNKFKPNEDGVEIYGGKGLDMIYAGGKDTTENYIWAHGGDDVINLYGGKNTIMLVEDNGSSYGNDTIVGATANDTLKFVSRLDADTTVGAKFEDMSFTKNGDDLKITVGDDVTTIDDFFRANSKVDTILTTDGEKSIKDDAVINVEITQAGEYSASDYKEAYTIASGIAGNVIIHNLDGQKDSITLNDVNFDDITFFHRDGRLDMAYGNTLVLLAGYDSATNKLSSITTSDGTYGFAVGNDATEFSFSTESTGNNIIIGALDGDKLNFTDIDAAKVLYTRNALGDLVITTDKEGFAVTLKGFFSADVHKSAHLDTIKFNGSGDVSILNNAEINVNADSYFLGYNVVNDTATAEVGGYKEIINVTSGNLSNINIDDAVLNAISSGDITKTHDDAGYHYTLALGKDKELASIIVGQLGDDTIYDSDGNDYLAGANGDDKIYSTKGEDALIGGEGADYLYAKDNTSDVEIYGGAGNDEINSGSGNDFIWGGSGDDKIHLNGGNNRIILSDDNFGSDTIYGATANDKLEFVLRKDGEVVQGHNFDELIFVRNNADLEIFVGNNSQATISGFFNAESPVDTIIAKDGEKSIKDDAVFNVVLTNGETFNKAESDYAGYRVAISGNGYVMGMEDGDKLAIDGEVEYSRINGGGLTVSGFTGELLNDKITVMDFAFINDGKHDIKVNGGTTANATIKVTIKNDYTYDATTYPEVISGEGFVKGMTAEDSIVDGTEPAAFARHNDGGLEINDNLVVLDFFENGVDFNVNGTSTEHANITVTLDNFDYKATRYAETISGTGTVTGMTADDSVSTNGAAASYSRLNDGGLTVNGLTITDYFTEGQIAKVNDVDIPDGAALDVTLTDAFTGTYECTRFAETISGTGSVTGMTDADKLITAGEPSYTRTDKGNLFVDGIEVKDFIWDGNHNINVNNGTTAAMEVAVTLTDALGEEGYTASAYKERIASTAEGVVTVRGLSAVDSIVDGTEPAAFVRHNDGGLEINDRITVADFFTNGVDFNVNGTSTADANIGVILADFDYTATGYAETISGTGSVTGMTDADKLITAGEPSYTRTDKGNLFVDGIEVKDFIWDGNHNINVNNGTTAAMEVAVTLTDALGDESYSATAYKENISVTATSPVKVAGLTSADNLNIGTEYTLSRLYNGVNATNRTLTITTADGKVVNVGSVTFGDTKPAFTVGGAALADALNVTASANYTAVGAFNETILVDGAITVQGLGDNDKLLFANETSYALSGEGLTITGAEGKSVTIAGISTEEGIIKANVGTFAESVEDTLGLKTLTVTGFESYDAREGKFGSYDITGTNVNENIFGSDGDDVIDGAAGDDVLTGGAGADTFIISAGADKITDAKAVDTIDFRGAYKGLTANAYGEDKTSLLISSGNLSVEIENYFDENGKVVADAVDTLYALNKDGESVKYSIADILNKETYIDLTDYNFDDLRFTRDASGAEGTNSAALVVYADGKVGAVYTNATYFADKKPEDNIRTKDGKFSVLNDAEIFVTPSEAGYTGTKYNETVDLGTDADTYDMKTGIDKLNFTFEKEGEGEEAFWTMGDKVVKVTKDEKMYLNVPEEFDFGTGNVDIQQTFEVSGKDLLITITAAGIDYPLGTITVKDAAGKNTGAEIYVWDDGKYENVDEHAFLEYTEAEVTDKNTLTGSTLADDINVSNYITENGKGVKIDSKSGNDVIVGSNYNDTVKASSLAGEIATVTEYGGTNKITTGNGNDIIEAKDYSSNTINAGAGDNIITLSSVGKNTVTAKDGRNLIMIDDGSNNVKVGKGNNMFDINAGTNTIKTGAGENVFYIDNGVNKITSGKKQDRFYIEGGNNTISSGVGEDVYNIVDGYNTIKTGNAATTFNISDSYDIKDGDVTVATVEGDGGVNVITSGSKKDTFNIDAGVNTIKSGSGVDTFYLNGGKNIVDAGAGEDVFFINSGKNTLNGAKGNDRYEVDLTDFDFNAGQIVVTDTAGKNILNAVVDSTDGVLDTLNVFFDVTVKTNKSGTKFKGATYSNMVFSTDDGANITTGDDTKGFDEIVGIDVSSKKAFTTINTSNGATGEDALSHSATISTKQLDKLANDVASWMFGKYTSTDAVFEGGNVDDINALVKAYTDFAKNDYVFDANNSLNH